MAVQLVVDIEGTAELDGTFTVLWTATSATDMPTEVFVHKFSTEKFDHVAVPGDLQFPTAKTPSSAWYRQASGSCNYPTQADADAAKAVVATALQDLVDAYNAGLATFLTNVTLTLDPT